MSNGNNDVILCERGIRAVGQSTRFTLDVAAVPILKAETHLPVIVDPSHAAGRADLVGALSVAAIAACRRGMPWRTLRAMFSTTTMESSTSRPVRTSRGR